MTLTNEQLEKILDGAPEGATHYVHADNEYWDLARSNDHPKVWDDYWIAVDYDSTTHMDIFSASRLSDLREILTLRQRVEDLEAQVPQWISVDERLPEKGGWYMVTIYDPFDLGYIADYGLMAHFSGGKSETWSECDPVDDGCVVTHWMPLIKGPYANQLRKGEGDE